MAKLKLRRRGKKGKKIVREHKGILNNYTTRTQALKKLQLSLKDFRRLAILKGIYPREPAKKVLGKDKTYYYTKDIAFLAHDPLVASFREHHAYAKKIKKAKGRYEHERVASLRQNRPEYSLDHIVRQRCPTFADALRELDDGLSMLFLFASLPSDDKVKKARVDNAARLTREFLFYVVKSRALVKTFVSIKGIYYQVQIGSYAPITFITPHRFTTKVPKDVDVRVMLTFLEFYETVQAFVNYRLFVEIGYAYPPALDSVLHDDATTVLPLDVAQLTDASAVRARPEERRRLRTNYEAQRLNDALLAKAQRAAEEAERAQQLALTKKQNNGDSDNDDDDDNNARSSSSSSSSSRMITTRGAAAAEASAADDAAAIDRQAASDFVVLAKPGTDAAVDAAERKRRGDRGALFSDFVFFLSRETPRESLEIVVRACGGELVLDEGDERITHHIVDRDWRAQHHRYLSRTYVQPQWTYDCVNENFLLPVDEYRPGVERLPPHLSPFVDDANANYVPERREELKQLKRGGDAGVAGLLTGNVNANDDNNNDDSDDDDDDDVMHAFGSDDEPFSEEDDEEDEDDGDEEEDDDDDDDDDDSMDDDEEDSDDDDDDDDDDDAPPAKRRGKQTAAAAAATTTTAKGKKKTAAKVNDGVVEHDAPVRPSAEQRQRRRSSNEHELTELRKVKLSNKARKLYQRMEYTERKQEAERQKLVDKRDAAKREQQQSKAMPTRRTRSAASK